MAKGEDRWMQKQYLSASVGGRHLVVVWGEVPGHCPPKDPRNTSINMGNIININTNMNNNIDKVPKYVYLKTLTTFDYIVYPIPIIDYDVEFV